MTNLTRRNFVKRSLPASLSLAAGATALIQGPRQVKAAPEKINVAVMGVRGRGGSLLRIFSRQPEVRLTHVCDVDHGVLDRKIAELEKTTGQKAKAVKDYRTIIDDPDVQVLVIGTPTHWHACPTILGCMAGKDIYVEKPDAHNILEGRMMVKAARKYNRIVQLGTQLRSTSHLHAAAAHVKSGGIGKVLYGKAWETDRQGLVEPKPDSDPPPHVDYDQWLGPAPKRPFNPNRFHGIWRWFFDYGAGDMGNDGVHRLDMCRMVMGIEQMPTTISATGGKLFFDDAQEWPDTLIATYGFKSSPTTPPPGSPKAPANPGAVITYEMRLWSRPRLHGATEGVAVYGEEGWVMIDNSSWRAYDPEGNIVIEESNRKANDAHIRNFLDAIRQRSPQNLNQEIASGHISSVLCHGANIAWRTGKTLRFDTGTETFDEPAANRLLGREYRKGYELPKV